MKSAKYYDKIIKNKKIKIKEIEIAIEIPLLI